MTNTACLMKHDTESVMGLNLESLPLNVNQGSFGREVLFFIKDLYSLRFGRPIRFPATKKH